MTSDDDFEPHLGRQRGRGKGASGRRVLHRIIAATNLARGGSLIAQRRAFAGSRIGRGAGVGRVLASRDRFAAFCGRRVMVKARIVRLGGKGTDAAKSHLRYIQRDGTTRDGERGAIYGADGDAADRDAFLDRGNGDRHQFRFIVSPEDGADYEDLKSLTRRLMSRMEEDLGTRLDWVAVDHFNTGHPHAHVVVRGKDERGRDLVIAPDYIRHGLRERACELVELDLGPRDDHAIERRLRVEVQQDRLTSIDRMLLKEADGTGRLELAGGDVFQQTIHTGRLRHLQRLGLASQEGTAWRLAPEFSETLRKMGERGDIVRTMQRAYTARGRPSPSAIDQTVFDPASNPPALVGRVVERGLADEHRDRHYLIVEGTDGRSHYVAIGKGEGVETLPTGAIVRIAPNAPEVRSADRTVADIAAAHGGRYSVDLHLAHDPSSTQEFAETHVRRLEAIRRATGEVERDADGSWIIGAGHLETAKAYETLRARETPVRVEVLSRVPLEQLERADAPTWLDIELTQGAQLPFRDAGFGQAAKGAADRRRLWLIEQDLAAETAGVTTYRPDLVAVLRRRELLRVAGQFSKELDLPFVETHAGERIEGILRRPVDLVGGRYALIERSREFTLVPWRPVLEAHLGKSVSGLVREGGVSWSIGRQRGGPAIS